MRVVFITMFTESMGGGLGRVAYEIVEAFAQKHKVLFIHPGERTKKTIRGNLWVMEVESRGKSEIVIPDLNFKNIKFIFRNLGKFSPEVVHVQDPGPLSFLLQLWAKKNGIPFVYTSHVLPTKTGDFGAKELSGKVGKLLDSKIVRKYFLNFFNNCDGVIALNKRAKKDILEFGYKGKIFLIPNGRNLKTYQTREKKGLKDKILVFIGYLTRRKNQRYLVEVMRYLPGDYTLKLVGPYIDEKYFAELENLVKKYKLENVCFIGKVPHERVPEFLAEARVFVSSSKMEVQSLSIIESLASGTPVVGLPNETIDEFIDASCGYNFPKRTPPKTFALKVKEICSLSESSYRKLSDNAKKKTLSLDWSKVVNETRKAYWELIESYKSQKTNFFGVKSKSSSFSDFKLEEFFPKQARIFNKNNWQDLDSLEKNKMVDKSELYIFLLIVSTFLIGSFYSLITNIEGLKSKVKL